MRQISCHTILFATVLIFKLCIMSLVSNFKNFSPTRELRLAVGVLAVALATGVGTGDLAAALDFGGSDFGGGGGAGGRVGR